MQSYGGTGFEVLDKDLRGPLGSRKGNAGEGRDKE